MCLERRPNVQLLKPNVFSSVCYFHDLSRFRGWRRRWNFKQLFLPPPSLHLVHDGVVCYFNRAFFLQCSPVTSVQSPGVLKSSVVDNRRILHTKPLSFKKEKRQKIQRRCKNDTPLTHTNTHMRGSSDGNHSSDAHSCIQLIVTDTWCHHWTGIVSPASVNSNVSGFLFVFVVFFLDCLDSRFQSCNI